MPARSSCFPPVTVKSSGEKGMAAPIRPFLEKGATWGLLSFFSQKKAEAGTAREQSTASARTGARARRKENSRFMGYLLIDGCTPIFFCSSQNMRGEKFHYSMYAPSSASDMMDTSKAVRSWSCPSSSLVYSRLWSRPSRAMESPTDIPPHRWARLPQAMQGR